MREDNYVGWTAFNAFSFALLLVVLMFFDPLGVLAPDRRGAFLLAGVLSVVALVFGVASFRSGPGRIGAVGGALFVILVGLGYTFFSVSPSSTVPQVQSQPDKVEGGPGQ